MLSPIDVVCIKVAAALLRFGRFQQTLCFGPAMGQAVGGRTRRLLLFFGFLSSFPKVDNVAHAKLSLAKCSSTCIARGGAELATPRHVDSNGK